MVNAELMTAILANNIPRVVEFLNNDSNKNEAAANSNEALQFAANRGYWKIVEELLKIPSVKANAAVHRNTVLVSAASAGELGIVKELLKQDCVLKDLANNNQALLWAITRSKWDVVQELLSCEAGRACAAGETNAVLCSAIGKKHPPTVEALLKIEAVRNIANTRNNQPLIYAIKAESESFVKLLLTIPIVVKSINADNHRVLRELAKSTSTKEFDHASLISDIIQIYRDNNVELPKDIFTYATFRKVNILSLNKTEYEKTIDLLQKFSDEMGEAKNYVSTINDLVNAPHFPSGSIYRTKFITLQNIIKKIDELNAELQTRFKAMQDVPETNKAAWDSFKTYVNKTKNQLTTYKNQILEQTIDFLEIELQTNVNITRALYYEKSDRQFHVQSAWKSLKLQAKQIPDIKDKNWYEHLLYNLTNFCEHKNFRGHSDFDKFKNWANALPPAKTALLEAEAAALEAHFIHKEALRLLDQENLPKNIHHELLLKEIKEAQAVIEMIRDLKEKLKEFTQNIKETSKDVTSSQTKHHLKLAYGQVQELTTIMQKIKQFTFALKPHDIVKNEAKKESTETVLVWSGTAPKITSPQLNELMENLMELNGLSLAKRPDNTDLKSDKDSVKNEFETLMTHIQQQILNANPPITASTIVADNKPLSQIFYELFSHNPSICQRLNSLWDSDNQLRPKG